MVSIILSCHFTTNSRESLHIIGTFDYSYFTAYVHITHINGHTQLWLFVNDRFEFLILQILYIGIFESLRIEQLEIRIYEKRPQTRSNVVMATNIFSQGARSGIFSENLKKSKLSILEIRTFDSKPTIYMIYSFFEWHRWLFRVHSTKVSSSCPTKDRYFVERSSGLGNTCIPDP